MDPIIIVVTDLCDEGELERFELTQGTFPLAWNIAVLDDVSGQGDKIRTWLELVELGDDDLDAASDVLSLVQVGEMDEEKAFARQRIFGKEPHRCGHSALLVGLLVGCGVTLVVRRSGARSGGVFAVAGRERSGHRVWAVGPGGGCRGCRCSAGGRGFCLAGDLVQEVIKARGSLFGDLEPEGEVSEVVGEGFFDAFDDPAKRSAGRWGTMFFMTRDQPVSGVFEELTRGRFTDVFDA